MKPALQLCLALAVLLAIARQLSSLELQTRSNTGASCVNATLAQEAISFNSTTGTLKGTVIYNGIPPEPQMIGILNRSERNNRGVVGWRYTRYVPDETLIVDPKSKGIQWVIVRIMDAKPTDAPPQPVREVIDQEGYRFSPHILIVPPKTEIVILNPHSVMNNFHTLPFDSDDPPQNFAFGQYGGNGTYKPEWLPFPDLIQFKSDVFHWMEGYIVCHDPRYCAVTSADGTFEIKNLPPGIYKLNVWHERFGDYKRKQTIDVEIKAGAVTDLGEMKYRPTK